MTRVAGNKSFWEDSYRYIDTENIGMISFAQYIFGVSFSKWDKIDPWEVICRMFDDKEDSYLDKEEVEKLLKIVESAGNPNSIKLKESLISKYSETPTMTYEQFKKHFSHYTEIIDICQAALLSVLEISEEQQIITKFENQAAGHAGDILKDGATILKSYCEREFRFYELIKKLPKIQNFFATYYGRKSRAQDGAFQYYIVMEDLTHGMKQPCIMDLKMARNTWEPTAPAKKKVEQSTLDRISTSGELGFRICGMRAWQIKKKEYIIRDKPWGMYIKSTQMEAALRSFFHNGIQFRDDLVMEVLPQLYDILEWFKVQRIFRFYGSSILFVYDGANVDKPVIKAKMVDFAHTVRIRDGGKDDSYKYGLVTLIDILENILGRKKRTKSIATSTNGGMMGGGSGGGGPGGVGVGTVGSGYNL
eukprot:TRINITY_DN5119_c0_g1_i1.p1 TRINITY_DN5119_c0_g1~~TRINITY_DN5119_c0_g1_i1.p1  ORF type:complete len:444 (-),score=67.81 TRINITY_DN5119_c0_g1_i1:36-1292(-)